MKKLLSIMLVLTMALTLLAGCGGPCPGDQPAAYTSRAAPPG
jgi:N-acetylglucosamine transport system substrate-binding protein